MHPPVFKCIIIYNKHSYYYLKAILSPLVFGYRVRPKHRSIRDSTTRYPTRRSHDTHRRHRATTSTQTLIYNTPLTRWRFFSASLSKDRHICSRIITSRRNVKLYHWLCTVQYNIVYNTFAMPEKSLIQRIRSLRARTRVTAYGHFVSTYTYKLSKVWESAESPVGIRNYTIRLRLYIRTYKYGIIFWQSSHPIHF